MTIKDEMLLIEAMTDDLKESVLGFDEHAKAQRKNGNPYKPSLGCRSSITAPGNEVKQSETSYAIERKIVTIREHLNTLRKQVVNYYGEREDDFNAY